MTLELEVVPDPAQACAALMVSSVGGGGEVVLAGGSTPRAAYERFVDVVRARRGGGDFDLDRDLARTRFWIGDERCVEPADDRSNFAMIKGSLLDPLGELGGPREAGEPGGPGSLGQPVVRRIKGELGPQAAADDYERELREAGPPEFDLVLLGIGPDGHTASLFPGQPTLSERSRLAIAVPVAGLEPFVSRVTLTIPALTARSRLVVILASGEAKADAVTRAFGPGSGPDPLVPASMVAPEAKRIIVLLDPAAASGLQPAGRP